MKRKTLLPLSALLLGVLAILSWQRGAFLKSNETIRIGVNDWPPCEVWQVAEAADLFGEVNVEIVRFTSWGDNMRAMYDGKTDITHATWFNAAYFADKGESATVIQVIDTLEGGDGFVLRDGIDPRTDLRGRSIAVEVNTDEHFLLELALGDFGLSLEDVNPVALTAVEGYNAFVQGEVEGVFTYDPFLHDAAANGNGTIVWTTRKRPGYMVDVLVGRNQRIEEVPEAFETVVGAWHNALSLIRDDPERWMKLMADAQGVPAEEFHSFFDRFTFFSPEENLQILTPDRGGQKLELMLRFLRERDSTTHTGSTHKLFTNRFTPRELEP